MSLRDDYLLLFDHNGAGGRCSEENFEINTADNFCGVLKQHVQNAYLAYQNRKYRVYRN